MRQALPCFVFLFLCSCAGTIAPRRQVAHTGPPTGPVLTTPASVAPKGLPAPAPAPSLAHLVVAPDKYQGPGSITPLPVTGLEKPPTGFLNLDKTTVSGSISVAVGYDSVHYSRVDRIDRHPGSNGTR
ncbi:MAG: hypothetical protein JWM59_3371 [Verrucomicrobiales bacterium]|nr:hypothetical protein [Verrucomicrobiales bacterium]